jgi:hypothetical protein
VQGVQEVRQDVGQEGGRPPDAIGGGPVALPKVQFDVGAAAAAPPKVAAEPADPK